jgi:hypothetical protein
MNNDYILFNLNEALEELSRTIREIENKPDYDYGEFVVAMKRVYHHLNVAWNARNASTERAEVCSKEDFDRWRQFPTDLEMV